MRHYQIVRMAGDGVGPEIMAAASRVLEALAEKSGFSIEYEDVLIGGAAVDEMADPFPDETQKACERADTILLGAVGGPQYDKLSADQRPEKGLLRMRRALGLYANIRPVAVLPALAKRTAFKPGHLDSVDFVVMRELTGGIYFGDKGRDGDRAYDICAYEIIEIERIARKAGALARQRRGKVTSVDKENVLQTSKLWREVTSRIMGEEFPDIALEHMLVDAMAMRLISAPGEFDVILTENMFGDILTDEASMLAGSIGVLPSASIGENKAGVFEPIHGSAPDIAGKGIANPLGMIASLALALEMDLKENAAADMLRDSVGAVITAGQVTPDLGGDLSTEKVADALIAAL